MRELEEVIKGLTCCTQADNRGYPKCERCPYADKKLGTCDAVQGLMNDALSLLKAQESSIMTPEKVAVLQGFLLDIPSSESILNSVNCHAISLEDASKIIAICACACDVMSPSGFIRWLKERFMNDFILKECIKE
jgi:hypothetical protein